MTEERKKAIAAGRGFCLFLALVLVFGVWSAVRVQAAEPGTAQQKAATGILGENGGITWSYDAGTKTLTVSGEDELKGSYNITDNTDYGYSPFTLLCEEKEVERIVFGNCKLTGSAERLFCGLKKVKEIDLSGLDTKNVTYMEYMFCGCSGLRSLDVSGFEINSGTGTGGMFGGCTPSVLKAPKTVAQGKEILLDVSYRDSTGKVYTALSAENAGKELKRADDLITYEIQFSGNGATGGSTSKLTGCKIGTSYTLPANGFIRPGYTFTGWNTKADGTGTAYANKATVKDLTKTNSATVTLYAQWKVNSYSIAFKCNGSTEGEMNT